MIPPSSPPYPPQHVSPRPGDPSKLPPAQQRLHLPSLPVPPDSTPFLSTPFSSPIRATPLERRCSPTRPRSRSPRRGRSPSRSPGRPLSPRKIVSFAPEVVGGAGEGGRQAGMQRDEAGVDVEQGGGGELPVEEREVPVDDEVGERQPGVSTRVQARAQKRRVVAEAKRTEGNGGVPMSMLMEDSEGQYRACSICLTRISQGREPSHYNSQKCRDQADQLGRPLPPSRPQSQPKEPQTPSPCNPPCLLCPNCHPSVAHPASTSHLASSETPVVLPAPRCTGIPLACSFGDYTSTHLHSGPTAAPWNIHCVDNLVRIRARKCEADDGIVTPGHDACKLCSNLLLQPGVLRLNGTAGVPHALKNRSHNQLLGGMQTSHATISKLFLKIQNTSRKLSVAKRRVADYRLLFTALKDLQSTIRVSSILDTASKERLSVRAIAKRIVDAERGRFTPRKWTDRERAAAALVKILGGRRGTSVAQNAYGAPSNSTIRKSIAQLDIRPSNSIADLHADVTHNLEVHGYPLVPSDKPLPPITVTATIGVDEVASAETYAYHKGKGQMFGQCTMHTSLDPTLDSAETYNTWADAVEAEDVHRGTQLSVYALQLNADRGMDTKPIAILSVCASGRTKDVERKRFDMIIDLCRQILRPHGVLLTGLETDGDAPRRAMAQDVTEKDTIDERDGRISAQVGQMVGFSRRIGRVRPGVFVGQGYDMKHIVKRNRTAYARKEGITVGKTQIAPAVLLQHLHDDYPDVARKTLATLLYPADAMNVPAAVQLLQFVTKLRDVDQLPVDTNPILVEQRRALNFLGKISHHILAPLTDVKADLATGLLHWATASYLIGVHAFVNPSNGFQPEVVHDMTATIHQQFINVLIANIEDPTIRYWLVRSGTDGLEALFAILRAMRPNDTTLDPIKFAALAGQLAEVARSLDKYPELGRGRSDRRNISSPAGMDHAKPSDFEGDHTVGSVDVPEVWNRGYANGRVIAEKYGFDSAVLEAYQMRLIDERSDDLHPRDSVRRGKRRSEDQSEDQHAASTSSFDGADASSTDFSSEAGGRSHPDLPTAEAPSAWDLLMATIASPMSLLDDDDEMQGEEGIDMMDEVRELCKAHSSRSTTAADGSDGASDENDVALLLLGLGMSEEEEKEEQDDAVEEAEDDFIPDLPDDPSTRQSAADHSPSPSPPSPGQIIYEGQVFWIATLVKELNDNGKRPSKSKDRGWRVTGINRTITASRRAATLNETVEAGIDALECSQLVLVPIIKVGSKSASVGVGEVVKIEGGVNADPYITRSMEDVRDGYSFISVRLYSYHPLPPQADPTPSTSTSIDLDLPSFQYTLGGQYLVHDERTCTVRIPGASVWKLKTEVREVEHGGCVQRALVWSDSEFEGMRRVQDPPRVPAKAPSQWECFPYVDETGALLLPMSDALTTANSSSTLRGNVEAAAISQIVACAICAVKLPLRDVVPHVASHILDKELDPDVCPTCGEPGCDNDVTLANNVPASTIVTNCKMAFTSDGSQLYPTLSAALRRTNAYPCANSPFICPRCGPDVPLAIKKTTRYGLEAHFKASHGDVTPSEVILGQYRHGQSLEDLPLVVGEAEKDAVRLRELAGSKKRKAAERKEAKEAKKARKAPPIDPPDPTDSAVDDPDAGSLDDMQVAQYLLELSS